MSKEPSVSDPLIDDQPARYVVGIDLGTTNSAVAYVDTSKSNWQVKVFEVPQLTAPGVVEARETLPSAHYEAATGESADGIWRLPWSSSDPDLTVGLFARDQGGKAPGRMIVSAKSWLSHSGVDRSAALLPWHGMSDVERLSPVEVSARILRHIRDAWDNSHSQEPLGDQDVVLTLPASFDEVARELTVEAAAVAGLARVVLLEEPQAAFYAWVYQHRDRWQEHVRPGQTILVCDIGGGTSDFTLIRVRAALQDQGSDDDTNSVQFHRVAVGNHLILGGDNLDLALAKYLESRLSKDGTLACEQWDVLVRSAQRVKEQLLSNDAPDVLTLNLPAAGSKLLSGGLQLEVSRDEVVELLVSGFLPPVELTEIPERRASGFQEFGLPFASDPAITRHLAAFLAAHRPIVEEQIEVASGADAVGERADPARPDIVLFNGGFFASGLLRERLIGQICAWFQESGAEGWSPQVLDNDRLDLAVARGAAYFGMVRRGEGVRIAANLARSYFVGVDSGKHQSDQKAVCLVPGSAEPGEDLELNDRTFLLRVSDPVEFPLYSSSTRLTDRPGDLVEIDPEQMTSLPPIRTVLRTQRRRERGSIAVRLGARLTEIGTIELGCRAIDRDRSWRLQFDVRSATQTDIAAHQTGSEIEGVVDEETWLKCQKLIQHVFSTSGHGEPERLPKELSAALEIPRNQWPTALLRRIWQSLMELESGRRRSAIHEARWVNLLGFALRPGYGFAVDDWRVTETWRNVQGKLVHSGPTIRNEAMVLWRRVAGGLSRGQQQALADPLIASIRNLHHRSTTGKTRGDDAALRPNELGETLRLLGSLELLDIPRKIEMGQMLVDLLPKRRLEKVRQPLLWALGRLGQRQPIYGPLNTVVPSDLATKWLERLLHFGRNKPIAPLTIMQLARRTDDRYRDLTTAVREDAAAWLEAHEAESHLIQLVRDGGQLDAEEQQQVIGESLPKGLRIGGV